MSSLDHFQAPLDTDMEKQRAELAAIIRRNTAEDGSYATACLLYTSPSPRDGLLSRMPSSA